MKVRIGVAGKSRDADYRVGSKYLSLLERIESEDERPCIYSDVVVELSNKEGRKQIIQNRNYPNRMRYEYEDSRGNTVVQCFSNEEALKLAAELTQAVRRNLESK